MRIFSLLILLLSCNAIAAEVRPANDQAMARFQERRFSEAIALFQQIINANPNDDQARYYLALAHAQNGKPDLAFQSLAILIQKDPAYYLYRAEFDRDFEKVIQLPAFAALTAQYSPYFLATDPKSKDRISLEVDGPYLFHQGAKIPLIRPFAGLSAPGAPEALIRRPQAQYKARFINADTVLVSWSEVDEKKKIRSGLNLFSKKKREVLPVWEGEGAIEQFYVSSAKPNSLLVLQLEKHFSVYEIKNRQAALLATYEGRIQNFNEEEGKLEYLAVLVPSPKNKPALPPETKIMELASLLEPPKTLPSDGL